MSFEEKKKKSNMAVGFIAKIDVICVKAAKE